MKNILVLTILLLATACAAGVSNSEAGNNALNQVSEKPGSIPPTLSTEKPKYIGNKVWTAGGFYFTYENDVSAQEYENMIELNDNSSYDLGSLQIQTGEYNYAPYPHYSVSVIGSGGPSEYLTEAGFYPTYLFYNDDPQILLLLSVKGESLQTGELQNITLYNPSRKSTENLAIGDIYVDRNIAGNRNAVSVGRLLASKIGSPIVELYAKYTAYAFETLQHSPSEEDALYDGYLRTIPPVRLGYYLLGGAENQVEYIER